MSTILIAITPVAIIQLATIHTALTSMATIHTMITGITTTGMREGIISEGPLTGCSKVSVAERARRPSRKAKAGFNPRLLLLRRCPIDSSVIGSMLDQFPFDARVCDAESLSF